MDPYKVILSTIIRIHMQVIRLAIRTSRLLEVNSRHSIFKGARRFCLVFFIYYKTHPLIEALESLAVNPSIFIYTWLRLSMIVQPLLRYLRFLSFIKSIETKLYSPPISL